MRWPNLVTYRMALFAMQRLTDQGEERRLNVSAIVWTPFIRENLEALGFEWDAASEQYARPVDGFSMAALLDRFPGATIDPDVAPESIILTVDERSASMEKEVEAAAEAQDAQAESEANLEPASEAPDEDEPGSEDGDSNDRGATGDDPDGERHIPAPVAALADDDEGAAPDSTGDLSQLDSERPARADDRETRHGAVSGDADRSPETGMDDPTPVASDDRPDSSGRADPDGDRGDGAGADQGDSVRGGREAERGAAEQLNPPATAAVERNSSNFEIGQLLDEEFDRAFNEIARTRANLDAIDVLSGHADEAAPHLTQAERETLARYVGWGGTPKINESFSQVEVMVHRSDLDLDRVRNMVKAPHGEDRADLAMRYLEMRRLGAIRDSQADEMRRSSLNAHYTAPGIVRAVWSAVERLGFTEGRVIEPGVGVGNFFGLIPESIKSSVELHGVELDSTTARIASILYPDASIENIGFEKFRAPQGAYDLAIGNVPFGNYSVADPDYDKYRANIHNHFLLKSLDLVQPGGIVALLTSSYTLDAGDNQVRRFLAERGELLTAVRLPQQAFSKNANTDVSIDILVFRRADQPEMLNIPDEDLPLWAQPGIDLNAEYEDRDKAAYISPYFHANPQQIIGEVVEASSRFNPHDRAVRATTEEIEAIPERLERMWESVLPENVYDPVNGPFNRDRQEQDVETPRGAIHGADAVSRYRLDGFALDDEGEPVIVVSVEQDRVVTEPVKTGTKTSAGEVPKSRRADLIEMIRVRDAVVDVLNVQVDPSASEDEISRAREVLRSRYDDFVAEKGPLSRPRNARLMRADPQSNLLFALETYDPDKDEATKNEDIFTKRIVKPTQEPESAETADEALAVSLSFHGQVIPGLIADLLDRPHEDWESIATNELAGKIYRDPVESRWVPASEYLSGNIVEKLDQATRAAKSDPFYERNIRGLEEVKPEPIEIEQIPVQLSAPWLEVETVREYAAQICGLSADDERLGVDYEPTTNRWEIRLPKSVAIRTDERDTFSTEQMDFVKIYQAKLNRTNIRITTEVDGKRVPNPQATLAAREKGAKIESHFRNWLWSSADRANYYQDKYNRKYNAYVRMKADGSHLTFPGMNPAIKPRPHQKDAAWFTISQGNSLFAHEVGTGKTIAMISTLMELNRIGRARRNFLVVKRNTLNQIAGTARHLYPNANILTIDSQLLNKENRSRFLSRMATQNYDLAVMSHETFLKIGIHPETEQAYVRERLAELKAALSELDNGDAPRFSIKQIEATIARAESRLERLINRREAGGIDDLVTIEHIAPGAVAYDESQALKNIDVASRTPALQNQGSDRANVALMMFDALSRKNENFIKLFASGTPVSNSFSEVFGLFRFLAPETLHEVTGSLNEYSIDEFAGLFVATEDKIEMGMQGTYQPKERIKVTAIPELMSAMHFMDVRFADDLGIERPRHETKTISAKPSVAQQIFQLAEVLDRAEAIANRDVDPRDDNYLKLGTDGRKMATDPRLYHPAIPDDPGSKLNLAVKEISKRYWKYGAEKGTQAVFLDYGVPKSRPEDQTSINLYEDMKTKLVAEGVDPEEIAFIHDYDKDAQKEKLFDDVNTGKIRIIIGSTEKMGVGTNMQQRMVAGHHVSMPAGMRPSDMEQRIGRYWRQGNMFEDVETLIYTTEDSFDLPVLSIMESKGKMIRAVMKGDLSIREIEESEGIGESFDEIMAATTNDPAILEKIEAETELAKIQAAVADHDRACQRASRMVELTERSLENMGRRKDEYRLTKEVRDDFLASMSPQDREEGRFWRATMTAEGKLAGRSPRSSEVQPGDHVVMLTESEMRAALNKVREDMAQELKAVPTYQRFRFTREVEVEAFGRPVQAEILPRDPRTFRGSHSQGDLLDSLSATTMMLSVRPAEGGSMETEAFPSGINKVFMEKADSGLSRIDGRIQVEQERHDRAQSILDKPFDGHQKLVEVEERVDKATESAQKAIDVLRARRMELPFDSLSEYVRSLLKNEASQEDFVGSPAASDEELLSESDLSVSQGSSAPMTSSPGM